MPGQADLCPPSLLPTASSPPLLATVSGGVLRTIARTAPYDCRTGPPTSHLAGGDPEHAAAQQPQHTPAPEEQQFRSSAPHFPGKTRTTPPSPHAAYAGQPHAGLGHLLLVHSLFVPGQRKQVEEEEEGEVSTAGPWRRAGAVHGRPPSAHPTYLIAATI